MQLTKATQEENILPFLERVESYLGVKGLALYYQEIAGHSAVVQELESMVALEPIWETKKFSSVWDLTLYRIINYCLLRELKPQVMVETGVLHGLTTQFLLHALHNNGTGKLISIDYPSYFESGPANQDGYTSTLPPKRRPGWAVSEKYRSLWELRLGKSLEELPTVFSQYPNIDIFLHDSEHTYETMWSEMNLAWHHLRESGVLIVDNINANTSFFDLCVCARRTPFVFPQRLDKENTELRFGLIRK